LIEKDFAIRSLARPLMEEAGLKDFNMTYEFFLRMPTTAAIAAPRPSAIET
jgi:hypothetical protein